MNNILLKLKLRLKPLNSRLQSSLNLRQHRIISGIMASMFIVTSAHAAPTMRGFQVPLSSISNELISTLKTEWKVNLIRVQIGNNAEMDGKEGAAYDAMMEEQFTILDQKLPILSANGMKMVFVFYSPPGGFETRTAPSHYKMFSNPALQTDFINKWREIMNRYGSSSAIYSFDLVNEPALRKAMQGAGTKNWNDLLLETITAIRAIQPTVKLEVKPLYGDPSKLGSLPLISDANVSYSYNSYFHNAYQHTGVETTPFSIALPSKTATLGKLRQYLAPFYLKIYNAVQAKKLPASAYPPKINVGESAASACALDSGAFLNNLLDLLETDQSITGRNKRRLTLRSWENLRRRRPRAPRPVFKAADFHQDITHESYAIHAFDEFKMWDPRYVCSADGTLSLSTSDTERASVLKSYFAKNP